MAMEWERRRSASAGSPPTLHGAPTHSPPGALQSDDTPSMAGSTQRCRSVGKSSSRTPRVCASPAWARVRCRRRLSRTRRSPPRRGRDRDRGRGAIVIAVTVMGMASHSLLTLLLWGMGMGLRTICDGRSGSRWLGSKGSRIRDTPKILASRPLMLVSRNTTPSNRTTQTRRSSRLPVERALACLESGLELELEGIRLKTSTS